MRSPKIIRKCRRIKRTARRTGLAALLAALVAVLGGCGLFSTPDGTITEVETGQNGVKIEYHMDDVTADDEGDQSREVYLVPGSACQVDDLIQECAKPGDLLIQQGEPGTMVFASCAAAEAINRTPLRKGETGWNQGLDQDGDGVACDR